MAKGRLPYFEQSDFRGGINQEIEEAAPNQVEDARNVWARFGELQQRPGYIRRLGNAIFGGSEGFATDPKIFVDTSGGAGSSFSSDLVNTTYDFGAAGNFDANDILYFGFSDDPSNLHFYSWVNSGSVNGSTDVVYFVSEYWNGSEWDELPAAKFSGSGAASETNAALPRLFLNQASGDTSNANTNFIFANPSDWATTTVNGEDLYWIRWRAIDGDSDGSNSITVRAQPLVVSYPAKPQSRGFGSWYDKGNRASYWLISEPTAASGGLLNLTLTSSLMWPFRHEDVSAGASFSGWSKARITTEPDGAGTDVVAWYDEAATSAFIPEYGKNFIAYNHKIFEAPNISGNSSGVNGHQAAVETRDELVGEIGGVKSLYHPDFIAPLGKVPEAKYVLWHNSTLFAAGIKNAPHRLHWSAPSTLGIEGFRVWPAVNQADIVDQDQSGITGLFIHDEHAHVAKRDALYRMVFLGTTPEGLQNYEAVQVVKGTGFVNHHSIVNTPLGTAGLYEDGFYLYDGNQSRKISRPVDRIVNKITPNRYKFVQGVHWATQRCVLWTVSIDAPDVNDHIICWDYENNAWWIWDNIEAELMLRDEGDDDSERIYFLDSKSRLFEFGIGTRDNGGAITAYALTHRFGYKDPSTKKFRRLYVNGTNQQSTNDATVIVQDRDGVSSVAMDFTDAAEKKWTGVAGGAKWGEVATYSEKRRTERVDWRESGEYAQVKVQNSNKHEELKVSSIRLDFVPEGSRK